MTLKANWNYPTRVLVGAGRIEELPGLCRQRGFERPLLVTDAGLAKLPLTQNLVDHCLADGLGLSCFSDIKPNPTGANIAAGVDAFRAGGHDSVVALGGGSALDAAKAVALIARQACSLWELEDIGDNWQRADAKLIVPVIAVPTTAGTGSEVGRAALIVHEAQRRKVILFHPGMMPGTVILDPELTVGLPPALTAATGMDALSHSLEAWCSPLFHPLAEGIALQGIRLVKEHLSTAVANGTDIEARLHMLVASTMGATAFQRGLGAMHALAHPLGAVYDAHHGLLNAVLMPYVLRENVDAIRDRIAVVARHIDLAPRFDAFLEWVLTMRQTLGIPHTLGEILTPDNSFADIGSMALLDPSAATNPVAFSADDYQRIIENALVGKL